MDHVYVSILKWGKLIKRTEGGRKDASVASVSRRKTGFTTDCFLSSRQTISPLLTRLSLLTDIVFRKVTGWFFFCFHFSELEHMSALSCSGCWVCATWNSCGTCISDVMFLHLCIMTLLLQHVTILWMLQGTCEENSWKKRNKSDYKLHKHDKTQIKKINLKLHLPTVSIVPGCISWHRYTILKNAHTQRVRKFNFTYC